MYMYIVDLHYTTHAAVAIQTNPPFIVSSSLDLEGGF